MGQIEDILDHAIKLLKTKSSAKDAALSSLPEGNEVAGLLTVAKSLSDIHKKAAPQPAKRRLYINAPIKQRVWFAWLHVSKIAAVSTSIFLLLAASGGTVYAALRSLPGQALFPVRKTAERLALEFTSDPIKRANLQISLAQKRLSDAQKVFQSQDKNAELEIAALNELSSQTQETVDSVKSAATANAISNSAHPLVASLESINQQQQTLLNSIKPDAPAGQAAQIAKAASADTVAQISEIKKSLEIASISRDSNLANLNATDSTVTLLGTVTNLEAGTFMVEKTQVSLASGTPVNDASGTPTTLLLGEKIRVSAYKDNNSYIAKTVIVLSVPQGEVKGAETTTNSSSTPPVIGQIPAPQDNSRAVGGFIPEDPSPQYVPTNNP